MYVINHLDDNNYTRTFNEYFMFVVKDICLYKLQRYYIQKPKNNHFLVIKFNNKLIENINLKRIISSDNIKNLFPHDNDMSTPNITYSYTKTIRSQILNYKQTVKDISDTNIIKCNCNSYDAKFVNNSYGHIFTVDLDIIANSNLKNLLLKGLNYRDQESPNKDSTLLAITSAIDVYVQYISEKTNVAIRKFSAWKKEVLEQVHIKLDNIKSYNYFSAMKDPD